MIVIWHKISQKSRSQIHNDVIFALLNIKNLLKTVYIKIGAASSSFIQSYSNFAVTFNTSIALDKKVGFKITDVSLVLMTSST